jgi:hypothetical protein
MTLDFDRSKRMFRSSRYKSIYGDYLRANAQTDVGNLWERHKRINSLSRKGVLRSMMGRIDGGDCLVTTKEITAAEIFRSFGIKYYSQFLIGDHLCDFYLPQFHYVVEIDGMSHLGRKSILKDGILIDRILGDLRIPVLGIGTMEYKTDIIRQCKSLLLIPECSPDELDANKRAIASSVLCLHKVVPFEIAA